jgi:hypothetical protein
VLTLAVVTDLSSLLALDLVPLDIKSLGEGVLSESASLEVLRLRVPLSSKQEDWFAAFRQSAQLTLRSISISGGYLVAAPQGSDTDSDGPQSQRPLPKSPSLIAEYGDSSSPRRQEREERGWWSSCFHQVLTEFQARDVS